MSESTAQPPILVDIPEGLEEIVPDYLDTQIQVAGELPQMLDASELEGIRRIAHNLKNGAAFGFPRLTEIGFGMERSLRKPNVAELTEQIKNLGDYLRRVELRVSPLSPTAGTAR